MASPFRCSIVTPQASTFDGEVTYASFQAWDGQQGVLSAQSPLLTKLGVGSLRIDLVDGGSRWFLLAGGFAQLQDDVLTLLTDEAVPAEDLTLADAEAELAKANADVVKGTQERSALELTQQKAMAKVALARSASRRR